MSGDMMRRFREEMAKPDPREIEQRQALIGRQLIRAAGLNTGDRTLLKAPFEATRYEWLRHGLRTSIQGGYENMDHEVGGGQLLAWREDYYGGW